MMRSPFFNLSGWLCAALLTGMALAGAEEFRPELVGDIGLGGYYTRSIVRGNQNEFSALPYLDFEYGRLFARVDTLGVKTLKMGYGYLELVGRISQDGFNTNAPNLAGLGNRETSVPIGVGTLQVTPLGGVMINAFHDVNRSQGDLFEVIYGGQIDLPRVTLYPLIGGEYQSRKYVRYYYGISPLEAANSQYAAYQPAAAVNGLIGLIAEISLTDEYYLNCNVRRKWLGNAIQLSPVVSQGYLDTGYISLSYRFR
ncbi:MAG: MipA/OmpV family protein [Gallionella sp.]|nr:MipA/OmpV family protein [Gallionella sp.]